MFEILLLLFLFLIILLLGVICRLIYIYLVKRHMLKNKKSKKSKMILENYIHKMRV